MWTATCVYCLREIKNGEACYFVYEGKEKVGYRHVNCHPPDEETQPLPWGHVTDQYGELD